MLKGIALKVAATLAFSIMSALIKAASARFPVAEVVLFRSQFPILALACPGSAAIRPGSTSQSL
jgi:hypothetical protein